jgi:hypothetical protein
MSKAMEAALEQCLEHLYAPSANCSCNISPPCNDCVDYSGIREAIRDAKAALSQQPSIDALQYKIDNLMLEYCPDEMTKEQIANWEKHQIPSRNSDVVIPISGISQKPSGIHSIDSENIWQWESRGGNNLQSLTCPILINADDLRDLLSQQSAQPSCEPVGYEQFRKQCADACLSAVANKDAKRAIGDAAHYVACNKAILEIPLPSAPDYESMRAENERLEENAKRLDDLFGRAIADRNSTEQSMCEFRVENEQLKEALKETIRAADYWCDRLNNVPDSGLAKYRELCK